MVNYLAILVAAVVAYVIGALWYSPLLFGKMWMSLSKVDPKKMKMNPAPGYIIGFLTTLIMAYVLGFFLELSEAATAVDGLTTAFWIWLGFLATTMLGSVLWEGKPLKLYVLNAAHSLVSILIMGVVLAVWV